MAESLRLDLLEKVEPEVHIPSLPPVTDHQREVASQAMHEFEMGQYEACCQTTNKLFGQRASDPKVVHNKAVADFYNSKFSKTTDFRQSFIQVCHLSHIPSENAENVEDVDHGIIYYNQAILLYRLHQYRAALAIVDKLFQFIEPLEENLAKKIMFLVVELYLCTNQPEKGIGMLTYMEKALFNGGKSGGGAGGQDKGDSSRDKDNSQQKGHTTDDSETNDATKNRMSQYKARCYLMVKSMKSCKREIKTLMNAIPSTTAFGYLKSNFEYIRGNYRKANKVLGSTPQSQEVNSNGESLPVMYFNNLGCTHFHMRKHHLGVFYFRKAVQENENVLKSTNRTETGKPHSGQPALLQGTSRHYNLMYNMGIAMLHCGKPVAAFDCLMEAVQHYQINPRLWLRLAECCIMEYRENNEVDKTLAKRLEPVKGSVGSGIHRKLIMGTGISNYKPSAESAAIPIASLEFAALCLRNALVLLPDDPSTVVPPVVEDHVEGSKSASEALLVPVPPGNPMKAPEVANLRCSILCAASYVSLCLHDYVQAIGYAENLLKQPRLSGAQKYLGNMYSAEALVAMDKIADAIQHLNLDAVIDISTVPPEHKTEQEKLEKGGEKGEKELLENGEFKAGAFYGWTPREIPKAKALMQYNLATAHAIRGEFSKAMSHLGESAKTIGILLPAQMYFLRLYLDLIEGRRKMAQIIIKDYFGHMTPNRVELKVNTKAPSSDTPTQWQPPMKGSILQ